MNIITRISRCLDALKRCEDTGNEEWVKRHRSALEDLASRLPSGSGFDAGTTIDTERSKTDRIVLATSFHHMDEHGCYEGWSEHEIIVTPSLTSGFDLRVTGRNRNDIKEYIGEVFHSALGEAHKKGA